MSSKRSLMTLSNKKTNLCDHTDRISNLPSNVIETILEHLNIEELVRTSILARNWRYTWISVPRLEFNTEFCRKFEHLVDSGLQISRIITQVLLLHDGPIYKFTLRVPFESNVRIAIEDFRIWILFLSRRGIKYLELVNNNRRIPHKRPFHLFSCEELTYLKVEEFYMQVLPNSSGFKNLLVLHLLRITFATNALQSLISGCPLLENLTISFCSGDKCIDLSAPTLKVLRIEVDDDVNSINVKKTNDPIDFTLVSAHDSVSGLIKSLPETQRLTIISCCREMLFADMFPRSLLMNSLNSLEYLKLTAVDLNDNREFWYILIVIKSSPNLAHLVIESYSDVDDDDTTLVTEKLDWISSGLHHLKMVDIIVKANSQNAMSIISFILANSPLLETLTFEIYGLSSKESDASISLSVSLDLLRMKRASRRAQVELKFND